VLAENPDQLDRPIHGRARQIGAAQLIATQHGQSTSSVDQSRTNR
jgi:hypothetical protein